MYHSQPTIISCVQEKKKPINLSVFTPTPRLLTILHTYIITAGDTPHGRGHQHAATHPGRLQNDWRFALSEKPAPPTHLDLLQSYASSPAGSMELATNNALANMLLGTSSVRGRDAERGRVFRNKTTPPSTDPSNLDCSADTDSKTIDGVKVRFMQWCLVVLHHILYTRNSEYKGS